MALKSATRKRYEVPLVRPVILVATRPLVGPVMLEAERVQLAPPLPEYSTTYTGVGMPPRAVASGTFHESATDALPATVLSEESAPGGE